MRLLRCSFAFILGIGGCVLDEVPVVPDDGAVVGDKCKEDEDCQSGVCATQTETCVDCEGDAHCTTPEAARCEDNTCVPCDANPECDSVSGRPVCSDGDCVECTPEVEEAECGDNSCNPMTFSCSDIERNTRETCEPCVSDHDCVDNHLCIELVFGDDEASGTYCMQTDDMPCQDPYSTPLTDVTSVMGQGPFDFCGINTAVASCEAVLALFNNESCPCEGFGARCERVGSTDNKCTYSCTSPAECLPGGPGRPCDKGYCGSSD